MSLPFGFRWIWLLIAYLIGSIPTGYWLGKVLKGIDVRQHGSGNLGATNVFRVLGSSAGIATLLIDILKGFIPVFLFRFFATNHAVFFYSSLAEPIEFGMMTSSEANACVLIGLATVVGHTMSVFVRFKGGKGVATSAGIFLALMPAACGIAILMFALVMSCTQIVSISSIVAVLTLSISSRFLTYPESFRILSVGIALFVLWTHRANIRRLLAGTEPKLRRLEKGT